MALRIVEHRGLGESNRNIGRGEDMSTAERITIAGFKGLGSRDAYGVALRDLGRINPNIYVLTADCTTSVRAKLFADEFPDRILNFGIAEANMVSVAAGLALEGKIPFVTGFAMVMAMRACEQVRTDIAYPKLNVKVVGTHSGLSMGRGGASHQCYEDIAIMRSMANMTVVAPADGIETAKAAYALADMDGPAYLRLGRSYEPSVCDFEYDFEIGKPVLMRSGNDVTIMACGEVVHVALAGADLLAEQGISARVYNMHTIKPIDHETIIRSAQETAGIVTIEPHNIIGGLGGAVAEVVAEKALCPVVRIGVPDVYAGTGMPEELREKLNITPEAVFSAGQAMLQAVT
jgi:transketolase